MAVFVLDKHKKPLMPCTERRARLLLERGRAVVHKMEPFTIRLKDRTVEESVLQPLRLKLDPGSKVSGVAVLREDSEDESTVIFMGEIRHKTNIKEKLGERRNLRRSRRNRKTRYRKPRFKNRRKPIGWLPPSLLARVNQTMSVVTKLRNSLPITSISTEHCKFDTQKLQNPEISGVEYQQGELFGYEVREYLLEKWGRKCAYCGRESIPLQVEHIVPKSRGGTDRVSNLTLSCARCNRDKGPKTAEEFGYPEIQRLAGRPLRSAALMNATRWKLYGSLKEMGLPVECGSGALTKYNRIRLGLPKAHGYDAICVGGDVPEKVGIDIDYLNVWRAIGRGVRRMCRPNRFGFPVVHRINKKSYFGFRTGDLVEVGVPRGKFVGNWRGFVAVRKSGYFDVRDFAGGVLCQSASHKYFKIIQRNSGWRYGKVAV